MSMRSRLLPMVLGALPVLLWGCGSGGGGGSGAGSTADCSESVRKQFVLERAREWYLFPELLPATVDLAAFADAESLLDHLTATARL